MTIQLKPLRDQVMVITGASSGIGLATAQAAAEKKVKLVLAARSDETLKALAERICGSGGEANSVHCDVTDKLQVEEVARAAIGRFGRIDTWVNNAGIGMYGRLDEVDLSDGHALFDVNFWGIVYGSLVALPYLKQQGGALINVGSELSEAYAPLLGLYTASKHAVKGFTDTLRVEVEQIDNAPVTVTLIQPTAVNTPFSEHSRNFMKNEPKIPTPFIGPEKVAKAILNAAVKPSRSKKVGMKASINTAVATFMPSLADPLAAGELNRLQYDEPPRNQAGILKQSSESCQTAGRIRGTGGVDRPVKEYATGQKPR